ncbi:MAG: LysR substrate-binding domain-containing protein, partial [Gammaproteobacteria bacterium]|nr:LysR substrate-binding domain-containing protein [Gammaproteobacteria bacterium]
AADELNVTQSAISRQVQNLEAQLGRPLFERNGPRLALTPVGEDYLAVVREGLGIIRRGTTRLFRTETGPVFTISLLPSMIVQWFVPRLSDFIKQHPDISLRLDASYDVVDFAEATDIDAAIRFGEGHWPGVAAEMILDDVLVLVASPDMARRLKKPRDVLGEKLLVEDPHWDFWGLWLEAAGIRDAPPRTERLSDDTNVQIQSTMLGHGVTLARGMLVADAIREGRLVCPFKLAVRSPVQYYFVCPRERLAEEGVSTVKRWIERAAAKTVAGMERYWGKPVS